MVDWKVSTPGNSMSKKEAGAEARWRILFFWWFCHALVVGSARVIFETNLPGIISNTKEYRDFTQADVPALLSIGTLVIIVGKFSSGPLIAALDPYLIGVGSLLLCGLIIIACGVITPGGPLISIFLGWCGVRFFQSLTWPASNVLFDAWFPANEHGRAWGAMSTASRTGVMLVSFTLSISPKTNVQTNFLVCGAFLCLYSLILAFNLKNEPGEGTSRQEMVVEKAGNGITKRGTIGDKKRLKKNGVEKKTLAAGKKRQICPDGTGEGNGGEKRTFWNELFACTLFEPTFYCAALVQASTTPIAEFQSQLPIWLSMDKTLSPTHVSFGVSAWHAGILCSVSMFGIMFDHIQSNARKGILLAFPMFCNFACFSLVLNDIAMESTAGQILAGPFMKISTAFILGFTYAPAFYLCMGTWTARHATRRVMATSSSLVDVVGYGGSMFVLYLQQGDGMPSTDNKSSMVRLISTFTRCSLACAIALLILFVYFEEHYHQKATKVKDE